MRAAAPPNTSYLSFGSTCGWRIWADSNGDCAAAMAGVPPPGGSGDPITYGDDPTLDAFWDGCGAGNWVDCDELYLRAPAGTNYQAWGFTCGNRIAHSNGDCANAGAGAVAAPGSPHDYGDDAHLDGLWNECAQESWKVCDQLAAEAPAGSNYRAYGESCGNRRQFGAAKCEDRMNWQYGDNPDKDVLWDRCASRDWLACDQLYARSSPSSEYQGFGDTCGDLPITSAFPTSDGRGCLGSIGEAYHYGHSEYLDILYDKCLHIPGFITEWAGSCDLLYEIATTGSDYSQIGGTCGLRVDAFGTCQAEFWSDDLNSLLRPCDEGDWQACDDLFARADADSYYSWFGLTCGGMSVPASGTCTDR